VTAQKETQIVFEMSFGGEGLIHLILNTTFLPVHLEPKTKRPHVGDGELMAALMSTSCPLGQLNTDTLLGGKSANRNQNRYRGTPITDRGSLGVGSGH